MADHERRPRRRGSSPRRRLLSTSPATRERLLRATYACAARHGLARTTVDDVAAEAGMSRATVYRYFPGGRDELVAETVSWEIARFFTDLARRIEGGADFESMLVEGLLYAHAEVAGHDVLQRVLLTEPDDLLVLLSRKSPALLQVMAAFVGAYLPVDRLQDGLEPAEAADHLARMVLSLIASPGTWNLSDRDEVTRLVRTQLLAGVVRS